jgi:hypothetical protein
MGTKPYEESNNLFLDGLRVGACSYEPQVVKYADPSFPGTVFVAY